MKTLQILGTGCPSCRKLTENTEAAATRLGIPYRIEKVTEIEKIMAFGVMSTPALAVDGVVKLSVNGKFVNGVSKSSVKKGYLCLESEGAEIHFRNIRLMELPPGVTSEAECAPVVQP